MLPNPKDFPVLNYKKNSVLHLCNFNKTIIGDNFLSMNWATK